MFEIPLEKQVLHPPKIMQLNHKHEASGHRSRSANNKKLLEAMNELEGIERHDVKIAKYTRSDLKKHKLSNGRPKDDNNKEGSAIQELHRTLVEQEKIINQLNSTYETLELQLRAQTDLLQHCKKGIDAEWESRKDSLREQVIKENMDKFQDLIEERIKAVLSQRKAEISGFIVDLIKDKLEDKHSF